MQHCTIFVWNPCFTSVMQICFTVYFFICQKQLRNLTRQMCQAEAAGALPPCKRWLNQPSYSHSLMSTLPHNTHLWHLLCMNVRPRAEQQFTSAAKSFRSSCVCAVARGSLLNNANVCLNCLWPCFLLLPPLIGRVKGGQFVAGQDPNCNQASTRTPSWFGSLCWHLYGREERVYARACKRCALIVSAPCFPPSIRRRESCAAPL